MIARLFGTVVAEEGDHIVIDVGGVGYEVRVPASVRQTLPLLGEPVVLYVRTLFSEDEGASLYGFTEQFQRRLFDLLIKVNGVGPKLALNLMSASEPEALAKAIARKDARYLKSLPGVGAKLAERLVLELADKVTEFAFERQIDRLVASSRSEQTDTEALVEGLVQLGYTKREALATVQAVLNENPHADEPTLMRLCLSRLSPRR